LSKKSIALKIAITRSPILASKKIIGNKTLKMRVKMVVLVDIAVFFLVIALNALYHKLWAMKRGKKLPDFWYKKLLFLP
jgi:hypothetical protein